MFLRLLLLTFSTLSHAQTYNSLIWDADSQAYNSKDIARYEGERGWAKLKESYKVTLNKGVNIYSQPEFAGNPSLTSWWPRENWRQRCSGATAPVTGKLLNVLPTFAVVEVADAQSICGDSFNNYHSNRNLVFVRREDIQKIEKHDFSKDKGPVCTDKCNIHSLARNESDLAGFIQSNSTNFGGTSPIKKGPDQERYFACYKTPHQNNYDRYYKKLFELAGKVFRVSYLKGRKPPIKPLDPNDFADEKQKTSKDAPFIIKTDVGMMKCVGLRESSWNPQEVSSTGAMGIGQQTQENIDHIQCLINGCFATREKWEKNKVVRDSSGKPVLEKFWKKKDDWAVTLWNSYFREAEKMFSADEWKFLTTNPNTGDRCQNTLAVKERDAPCPVNSIAGLALYHIVAELQMRQSSTLHKGKNDVSDFSADDELELEFRITQGTTTNAGTGNTQKTIKKYSNPADWARKIGQVSDRPGEVGDYAKYLRRCYESGNYDPYFKPPDSITKYVKGADGKTKAVKAPWEKPNCFSPQINDKVDQATATN